MDSGDEEESGIVIDNGCSTIRAGFAGDEAPTCEIPNVFGTSISDLKNFVGREAQEKRDILSIACPMSRGIIQNWDDMEKIWHYVFHTELHTSPSGKPVFISEAPLNPKSNREGIAKIMFEKFNVSSLYIAPSPVFSMYAYGAISGLAVSSGEAVTSIYPIFEGFPIPEDIKRIDYAGLDITKLVSKCLADKGYGNSSNKDIFTAEVIKKNLCYVALNYGKEKDKTVKELSKTYRLPDGNTVSLDVDRFKCTEPVFQPEMFGLEHEGLAPLVRKVVMNGNMDLRKSFCENIILSGGNTMFPGFVERFKQELKDILPHTLQINIRGMEDRKNSVFTGMSILGSMSNYKGMWISKQEYDEHGPEVIHRNCV